MGWHRGFEELALKQERANGFSHTPLGLLSFKDESVALNGIVD